MDAIFKFHKCGFEVCAVLCDGASSNMAMVKELTGSEWKALGCVCYHTHAHTHKVNTMCINNLDSIAQMTLKTSLK